MKATEGKLVDTKGKLAVLNRDKREKSSFYNNRFCKHEGTIFLDRDKNPFIRIKVPRD